MVAKILIGPCCAKTEVRHEWFPRIGAGESVRVDVEVPLPEGMAMAMASVKPWQGYKAARESDPDKHPDVATIGYPSRPR